MQGFSLSIQRFAAFMVSLFLVGYFFLIGKPILAPLLFASFLAFLLKPLASAYERLLGNRAIAVFLSILSVVVPFLAGLALLGMELGQIISNLSNLGDRINEGMSIAFQYTGELFGMPSSEVEAWIAENLSSFSGLPARILTAGLGSSAYLAGSILLCLICIFFFLLYRKSFYNFFLYQFDQVNRQQASIVIRRIEQVTKEYLNGLLLVILILATLNTIGLYLIGIKLALFWGLLGACLAIIPYIGTTLGGMLPFIYAIATTGTVWQPIAVVGYYALVQSLEGNIITPKVVGNSVRVNPFIAILALVLGGVLWGVAGMILALPMIAVVKIIFAHIDLLKPVSELLRDDLADRQEVFAEKYDENRYRLMSFFRRVKP